MVTNTNKNHQKIDQFEQIWTTKFDTKHFDAATKIGHIDEQLKSVKSNISNILENYSSEDSSKLNGLKKLVHKDSLKKEPVFKKSFHSVDVLATLDKLKAVRSRNSALLAECSQNVLCNKEKLLKYLPYNLMKSVEASSIGKTLRRKIDVAVSKSLNCFKPAVFAQRLNEVRNKNGKMGRLYQLTENKINQKLAKMMGLQQDIYLTDISQRPSEDYIESRNYKNDALVQETKHSTKQSEDYRKGKVKSGPTESPKRGNKGRSQLEVVLEAVNEVNGRKMEELIEQVVTRGSDFLSR